MTDTLLDAVRRYSFAHADHTGVASTPISGLTVIRATAPSELQHMIASPLACLVLQGSKHVMMGNQAVDFQAGDSMLITADVPTVSQITKASAKEPYFSMVITLDAAIIAGLIEEMDAAPDPGGTALRLEPTNTEVADSALRLMHLLDRPSAIPHLHASLVREMHYWLLAGRHGAAIRRLGSADGHVQRIGRAVNVLRADFARAMPVEELAALAGMSPSSFHQHFRSVTSLSPLQFQKQLRLIEARRLMLAEGANSSMAAFSVGYESVQQFNREYRRMFGLPPVKEIQSARMRQLAA
ncbi:AraC family transcriptional regulator [Neorhizobium sp. NCHU2750]|uniref:AraC family transcriptional regulator n=1 Tax=Neorhizobium sp. NCHU2750 TaxID=1825976 RepID=UPI000E75D825|nr:AraC family transcriptional regulator [Neorhizobium sp. NCHU2750]